MGNYLLALETSCDETAAAVFSEDSVLSNIVSSQLEHAEYGGVIPELASRLHQQQIIHVVHAALHEAGITQHDLGAVAVTQGPGLLGALLVGVSFAKAYAWALGIPLIGVNHMEAHVMSNFMMPDPPTFPFLCLTVSGGHTQLVWVKDYLDMEILGQTIDDAAGEAFDKAAKLMNLSYPGGPEIDKLAQQGDSGRFNFPTPEVNKYDFSFSGIKTSLLYLIQNEIKKDPDFLATHAADLSASYQHRIVSILLEKLNQAAKDTGAKHLALAGGVSANSELRREFLKMCEENGYIPHIPAFEYCTDNAAMIGIVGYHKLRLGMTSDWKMIPYTRVSPYPDRLSD